MSATRPAVGFAVFVAASLALVGAQAGLLDVLEPNEAAAPDVPALPGQPDHDDGVPAEDPVPDEDDPTIGSRLRGAFGDTVVIAALATVGVGVAGVVGFALVTRYVSPKEALKNPQRAMLYGFIRATPGAHLKQLSEEFAMKTSSILWHIRKLQAAELVRSERANGYRVFYPVEGGVEVKRLSRAITALHNENARMIHAAIERNAGSTVKQLSERTSIHPGTVRWHVRKLREFGLVEELVREEGSMFYATPLGHKAIEAVEGRPTTGSKAPAGAPVPE